MSQQQREGLPKVERGPESGADESNQKVAIQQEVRDGSGSMATY